MKAWCLSFILVIGVSLFAVAGEYLMNDTGAPVYGLRVVFSAPVELAGFGDVLNTVEPTCEASEFVFSGGEIEAWDGQWFNWAPVSALLVSHEWLADPAFVATSKTLEAGQIGVNIPLWMRNPT